MISADYALHWGIRTGKPIPNPAHYGYWYKTITPVEAYRRHGLHVLNPIPDPALYGPPPVPLSKIPLPPDLAELR